MAQHPDALDRPERVWLALPPRHPSAALLEETRDAIAGLAETLTEAADVAVLVDPEDRAAAARLLPGAVEQLPVPLDTPLVGRTGPTFLPAGEAVHWRLDPRSRHPDVGMHRDAAVGGAIARAAGLPVRTPLLAASRDSWVTDGAGTAVVDAGAVLAPEVNPGWSAAQAEAELAGLLGVTRVVWTALPRRPGSGPFGGPGHLGGWMRFVEPGRLAVHWRADRFHPEHAVGAAALRGLQGTPDAAGRALRVRTVPGGALPEAYDPAEQGVRSLVDAVPMGGHVLRPAFEDAPTEEAATALTAELHPGRRQLRFPAPPLLRLAGSLTDLVLVQPRLQDRPRDPGPDSAAAPHPPAAPPRR
ncbi:agmatine deiminase family protein [Micrococcus antarcticus]|uniref:agmatine deiminase family protein n=1 Tax=Micrococcus antarcticus TaxID=86171 RepID=UPI00384D913B